MPVLAGGRRLDLRLDQAQDPIHVPYEGVAVDDACHAPDGQEALAAVLVIGLADITDDASDGVFEPLAVLREDPSDVLVHDWNQLDALLLDEGVAGRLVQIHHLLHDDWPLILPAGNKEL